MKSAIDLRDGIYHAITSTYNSGDTGGWYAANNSWQAKEVTTAILAHIAWVHVMDESEEKTEYYENTMFNEIHQIIWISYPGGTTAAHCAAKICRLLSVEVPDLGRY